MFAGQDGVCAVCHKPESRKGFRLSIDHDHITEKIRGLLCYRCNTCLGWYENYAPNVAEYLVHD